MILVQHRALPPNLPPNDSIQRSRALVREQREHQIEPADFRDVPGKLS
jgi:hypothetical protein